MVDKKHIQELTKEFLIAIGEDPSREGLLDTPRRVANMCEELFEYNSAKSRYTTFSSDNYNGIVLIKKINFSSICEHHLLPFVGEASIAYVPNEKILGLSKLSRIVTYYSKKLQIQERFTQEVINEIERTVQPKGVAIYVQAKHLCMNIRGIEKPDISTTTTLFTGEFIQLKMQEQFMNMIRS